MPGEAVVTTEPAAEQTGQRCEPEGSEVKSAQKWNCAARKSIPRSKARKRSWVSLLGILLLRVRIRWKGCGVKESLTGRLPGGQPAWFSGGPTC
jgi:hypothetical protein